MKRTTITLAAVAGAALALATGAGAATLPGAALFAKSGCAACHTLKAAKAKGQVGPNLDKLKPSVAQVVKQVTNGGGGMPPYKTSLKPTQIRQIAAYVASVAGK